MRMLLEKIIAAASLAVTVYAVAMGIIYLFSEPALGILTLSFVPFPLSAFLITVGATRKDKKRSRKRKEIGKQ